MMLKVLSWPLIMSPFDQFMATNGFLVATFQFLLLAQVATKNRFLILFYGVLNFLVYVILGALFLVLQKLFNVSSLLFCVVRIVY